jgi:hypothetical protein
MSYSRRQLYAMGETFGESATRREVGGKVIYGSGGGGGTPANTSQKQTVTQDLPAWAQPYAKESLGKAQALSATPYQVYGGERIAQFSPLQKQAFQRAGQQQVAGQIGQATGIAGLASQQALGAGDFQTGVFDAERVGTSSFAQPGEASRFMSPYMDAVVQQQMESAQRQADIAGTQRGAQAVRAGAFGGSRQAVENAEAARALASQKGQIQATGLQSAFQQAQSQFNQEQDARMRAAMANQQAGFEAQRATEQSRQFGSNIGLQGAQIALQGAGQLGQLGQQQFGQQMDITGQQAQFGGQQRQATQDILSQQYQDFLNQQRAPYDQLAFMTSMIRGTPMGGTTAQYSTAPAPSYTSQLIGAGTAAAGAYGAYKGNAAGGEVKSYATGGIASLNQPEMAAMAGGMSDQQLQQTQGLPSITELARMTLAAEAQQRAQMRQQATAQQAMMQQQPQGTVAEEQMAALGGIGDLPAPNLENLGEGMAGGGIIAFAPGGDVGGLGAQYDAAKQAYAQSLENLRRYGGAKKLADPSGYEAARAALQQAEQALQTAQSSWSSATQGMAGPVQLSSGVNPLLETATTPAAAATSGIAGLDAAVMADEARKRAPGQAAAALAPAQVATQAGTATPRMASTGMGGVGGLGDLARMADAEQARSIAAQEEIDKLRAADVATARGELDELEKSAREFGSERETRRKKQEEELVKEKGQNIFKTMIQAGLKIAAGQSPDALKNIAEGAAEGLEGYEKRLSTIKSAQEKIDENAARLAEIREEKLAAVGADRRRLLQEERAIKTNGKAAIEDIMRATYGRKFSITEKQADRVFEMSKLNASNAAANLRAQMTDDRADNRARMSAAQDLLRSAQKIVADGIGDETEIAQAKADIASSSRVLRSASGAVSAPGQAIDALKKDPRLAAQFDAKYGPGASKQYLGS